ncbi:MAG: hypothetical protein ACFCU3_09955 [Verrucomicrobiales bacterium]
MKFLTACLLVFAPALSSFGATVTQVVRVESVIFDGVVVNSAVTIPNMVTTVQPFDSQLGGLVSFSSEHTHLFEYTLINSRDSNGGFGISAGGDLFANGFPYGLLGGGSGEGVPANSTVSGSFGPLTDHQAFLVEDADPALPEGFFGSEPVDLAWRFGANLGGIESSGISNALLALSEDSNVTVAYTFAPVSEPTSPMALFAFFLSALACFSKGII